MAGFSPNWAAVLCGTKALAATRAEVSKKRRRVNVEVRRGSMGLEVVK
jgi:hypothetical protein